MGAKPFCQVAVGEQFLQQSPELIANEYHTDPPHASNHSVFNKNRVVPTPLGMSCTVGRYTS